jgi:hypothetical protein
VIERSTDWWENAPFDPSPHKTSTLDLHEQGRSKQADATTTDGVCTVCSHTHIIIASSDVRAGELGQSGRNKGLLSGVEHFQQEHAQMDHWQHQPNAHRIASHIFCIAVHFASFVFLHTILHRSAEPLTNSCAPWTKIKNHATIAA